MARHADIDFTFAQSVQISEVVSSFKRWGFRFSRRGKISYVLDTDQMFEWLETEESALEEIVRQAERTDPNQTTFGISLFLDSRETGGDLLFQPGRETVSFLIEVNKVHLPESSRFCDFSWYLARMVPALESLGLVEIEATDSA